MSTVAQAERPLTPGPRALLVTAALLLPLAGLAQLIAAPELDFTWEHHPSHFWLVLAAGVLNLALAYATGSAARRRGDARASRLESVAPVGGVAIGAGTAERLVGAELQTLGAIAISGKSERVQAFRLLSLQDAG